MPSDFLKTLSFAALHFTVAFGVAWLLTGSIAIATGIGLIEPALNTVAFYFHERAWRRADSAPLPESATVAFARLFVSPVMSGQPTSASNS